MDMNEKNGTYMYNDESHNFKFRTNLSAAEKLRFVNSVVNLIVDESHYNSIIRDLVFDFYVVDIMTDVDTKELKDSLAFLNDVEDFLLSTNIVKIVKANAYPTLFDELDDAIEKSIQYLTGIRTSPLSDALASLISTLEEKVSELDLDTMMAMAQKIAGMTGEFTQESIAENIVKAYTNLDAVKK